MADYRLYCLVGTATSALPTGSKLTPTKKRSFRRALRPDAHRCEIWLKSKMVAKLNQDSRFEPLQH